MNTKRVSDEEKYHFDTLGFLLIKNVLDDSEIEKFRKAWNEVIQEKSAEDPLFKEVYASYSAFREKYAIWGDRAYLK